MPFTPTQDGALVVCRHHAGSEIWENHLWFSKPDFTQADQLALADMVLNEWYTYLDTFISDDFTYGPFYCYDMRTIDGPVIQSTAGAQGGESTGDPVPRSACCVMTLRTAKRGRAHRGRIYFAGFTEPEIQAGNWSSALQNALTLLVGELAGGNPGLGWTFGVRSCQLDGIPRNPCLIEPITSWEIRSPKTGSQRLRVKRG